jgi:RNA polymerase sigma-B factor
VSTTQSDDGSAEAALEEFRRYRDTGDRSVRDALIDAHRWIAERCARRFTQRGEPYDDLFQVAMLGLFKAVERFDPEQGTPFAGFAMPTVLGELRRHFRDTTWSVRVPRRATDLHVRLPGTIEALSQELNRAPTPAELAQHIGVTEEQVLEAIDAGAGYRASSLDQLTSVGAEPSSPEAPGGLASLDMFESRDQIRALLSHLPEREQLVIYLRFFEELSQQEIANRIGTSQVHVSRLIRSSLERMRARAEPVEVPE